MSEVVGANRAAYDRIASGYLSRQLEHGSGGDDLFAALEQRFRALVGPRRPVGDVGCGPALDGQRFASAGHPAVGIDLSAGMLRIAARHLPGRLAQGDLRALPLRPGALAGIWCVAALLHVPDSDTACVLGELWRSLRPGGALALVTALGDGTSLEEVPYAPGEHRWFVYRDQAVLERQLMAAGFDIRSWEVIDGNRTWFAVLAQRRP